MGKSKIQNYKSSQNVKHHVSTFLNVGSSIYDILQKIIRLSIFEISREKMFLYVVFMADGCLRGCLRGFTTIKNVEHIRNKLDISCMIFEKNVKRNEFGSRFINVGLENVVVAAARMVGGTSALQ